LVSLRSTASSKRDVRALQIQIEELKAALEINAGRLRDSNADNLKCVSFVAFLT
jgi:hypothetical protein